MKQFAAKIVVSALMGTMATTPAMAEMGNVKIGTASRPQSVVQQKEGKTVPSNRVLRPVTASSNDVGKTGKSAHSDLQRCVMKDNTSGKADMNRACEMAVRQENGIRPGHVPNKVSEGLRPGHMEAATSGLTENQKSLLTMAGGAAVVGGAAYYVHKHDKRMKRRFEQAQQQLSAPSTPTRDVQHQPAAPDERALTGNGTVPTQTYSRQGSVRRSGEKARQHGQRQAQNNTVVDVGNILYEQQTIIQPTQNGSPDTRTRTENSVSSVGRSHSKAGTQPQARIVPAKSAGIRMNAAAPTFNK